jgi:hypothetical protein
MVWRKKYFLGLFELVVFLIDGEINDVLENGDFGLIDI